MNDMRGLILVKYLVRVGPHSQISVLAAEKDPRFAVQFVSVRVGFYGLAYEAGAARHEDGGEGISGGVVFRHVAFVEEVCGRGGMVGWRETRWK